MPVCPCGKVDVTLLQQAIPACTSLPTLFPPCLAMPLAPQEVAERLSALAVKRGSQDNVAVVLIDLGKVDWSKSNGGGNGLFSGLGSIFGSR